MTFTNSKDIPDQESKKNDSGTTADNSSVLKRFIGMGGGLLLFIIMIISSPPDGLSQEGWYTAAIAILMAVWWTTEVIPIPATAMLPLVLFPLFNISGISAASAPYVNPMIFLFLGGFILAIGMQEWGLHRRIALNIIHFIGSKPRSIILGFIVSTAFMSMWVSNTAATMMMLPIALSVIELTKSIENNKFDNHQYNNFAVALMLEGTVPTINFRVDFLRPSTGPYLVARASVRRQGRTVSVVDIDVLDDQGRLTAVGRGCYSSQIG